MVCSHRINRENVASNIFEDSSDVHAMEAYRIRKHKVFRSDRIKITEKILKDLSAETVLEIGSGDYSFDYLKEIAKLIWIKADFSPPCDIICNFNAAKLILPFSEGAFDLIICTEVLEHLLWPQQLLKEINRVLSINGKALFSVPNISSLSYRVAWLFGHIPSCAATGNLPLELGRTAYRRANGEVIGGHVIDFNRKRILELIKHTGFKVIDTKGSGIIWHKQIFPHWIVPVFLASNIICLATKEG
jgi:SAM-dependent methyltransferase